MNKYLIKLELICTEDIAPVDIVEALNKSFDTQYITTNKDLMLSLVKHE